MKLELEVLDGPQKGKRISLKSGLVVGQNQPLRFGDPEMSADHAVLIFDNKNSWNIECLAPLKIRIGYEEKPRASLLFGLIFHVGQTGFKVVEKQKLLYDTWNEGVIEWLKENPGQVVANEIFFFLNAIQIKFIQGIQYEESYTLSYGPRELGHNHLDLNIKDPLVPHAVAKFFQIGEQSYVENLSGDLAKINGAYFDLHPIKDGDKLIILSNVLELSILK